MSTKYYKATLPKHHEVLHHLFAKVVINAVNLFFLK